METFIHIINLIGVFLASYLLIHTWIGLRSFDSDGFTFEQAKAWNTIKVLFAFGVMLMFV